MLEKAQMLYDAEHERESIEYTLDEYDADLKRSPEELEAMRKDFTFMQKMNDILC